MTLILSPSSDHEIHKIHEMNFVYLVYFVVGSYAVLIHGVTV